MTRYAQQGTATLQELRLRAGLSKRALARRAGVGDALIGRAEDGTIPSPESQVKVARALSEALGRPIDSLELWPLVELELESNGTGA